MNDFSTNAAVGCPHCGKPVDPLRAGAVSIAEGRIVHFCSATCREAHLQREIEPGPRAGEMFPVGDEEDVVPAEPEPESEPGEAPVPHSVPAHKRLPGLRSFLPFLLAVAGLCAVGVAIAILPQRWLGGWLLPGIAAVVVLGELVYSVVWARRQGLARMVEAAAVPLAAGTLVAVAVLGSDARGPSILSVVVVLAEHFRRLIEHVGRTRSGIVDVLGGAPPSLLASEWRDNSSVAAWIRRVTLVLDCVRFPLAAAIGLGLWLFGDALTAGLIAGGTALIAVSTRVLRLATGDAHLAVALSAAHRGVVIRDAHAVDRVGATRTILFMARHSLVGPRVKVVDWEVVADVDENAVLAAVAGVEAQVSGRIAEAVDEFASSRGIASREADAVEMHPGLGIAGQTQLGRVVCGCRSYLLEENISTAEHEPWATAVESSGRRALFVAAQGQVMAMFAAEEEPVSGAQDTVRGLSALGLEPAMITSAEVDAANALGARLGIENVRFETGEEKLGAALAEITGAGDTVLLLGHGPAFEQNLRLATAGFALGSEEPTMAGIDARNQGVVEVLRVVTAAREARRSVRINLVAALASVMIGLALAISWQTPGALVFAASISAAVAALATVNGPYPMLRLWAASATKVYHRLLRMLGVRRAAAP